MLRFQWDGKMAGLDKNHVKIKFSFRRPLSTDSLVEKIKNGSVFGCVQCNLIVPTSLSENFQYFLQYLKILMSAVTILEKKLVTMPKKMICWKPHNQ